LYRGNFLFTSLDTFAAGCIAQPQNTPKKITNRRKYGVWTTAENRVVIVKQLEKAQTPLIRFVVDLLYNKLYNKSTTNRSNGVCALVHGQSLTELPAIGM